MVIETPNLSNPTMRMLESDTFFIFHIHPLFADTSPLLLGLPPCISVFGAFPNPSSGQIQLNFEGNPAPTTIRITGVQGQQVFREFIRDFSGQYNQSLDLDDLPVGTYVLSVEQDGKVYAEQLIIK